MKPLRDWPWGPCTLGLILTVAALGMVAVAQDKPTVGASVQVAKVAGVIKSAQADSITVSADSGEEVKATLAGTTKILRLSPGEKDLKNATPLQAQDLRPGDRVLVRGQISGDAHSIAATTVIVMKQEDVAAKQQRDREDWQKRGAGGLVSAVDTNAWTISISTGAMGPNKTVTIRVAKNTVLRRYAPGSVKFDDAKPAPMDQIKVGDQLRARGTRSSDGAELTAEEIVSGSFRNIAGTVASVDTSNGTISVQDRIAKNAVVVKISADSQMKQLPAEMAQRIAARLKGGAGENGDPAASGLGANGPRPQQGGEERRAPDAADSRGGGGQNGNGPPDFQRMLSRLPNTALGDLHKGDTVMLVATDAGGTSGVTAITLLSGVEPVLTSAPNRSVMSLLSPWSLNTSGGEGEGGGPQ